MQNLRNTPQLVTGIKDCMDFAEDIVQEFTKTNQDLINKMNSNAAIENPDDWNRRKVQAAVMESDTSFHYDENMFGLIFVVKVSLILSMTDGIDNNTIKADNMSNFDFNHWPKNASLVGRIPVY